MDVLTDVLNSLRLTSTLYCRSELTAPWGLRFAPTRSATFHTIDRGLCWLHVDGSDHFVALACGDVLVLPHGAGHTIAHDPAATPVALIQLDQDIPPVCEVRHMGGDGAATTLLCGLFNFEQDNGHPLLKLLPPLIHIQGEQGRAMAGLEGTLRFLGSEAGSGRPGAETLIKRLADILFIQVVRHWVEHEGDGASSWLSALRDPQIGAALALIHAQPEQAWTVDRLATEVAMSRSGFAARFAALVGEPPLHYLAHWRMRRAAVLLARADLSMAEIAQCVGYQSEVAFNKAFKREVGITPGAYRRQTLRAQHVSSSRYRQKVQSAPVAI